MKTPEGSKAKAQMIRGALEHYAIIQLHIDGSFHEGLDVPLNLRGRQHVVFEIGHNMPIPIAGLEVTDEVFRGRLSFHGTPWDVVVPLAAVWAVTPKDGSGGVLFPEDAPESIRCEIQISAPGPVPAAAATPAPTRAPTEPIGARVVSLDAASRRLRGRPLRRGTGSGVFPTKPVG